MDDENRVHLEKADDGKGNTVRITYSFVQTYKKEFSLGLIPVYRVIKQDNNKFEAERVTPEVLLILQENALNEGNYIVSKNWRDGLNNTEIDPFDVKLQAYGALPAAERTKEITNIRKKIEEMKKTDVHPMAKAKAIMDAIDESFVINKASLKLNKAEVTVQERMVASETQAVVSAALGMVEEVEMSVMLFEAFKSLSNGQTLNHIGRVFGTMASFMHYYNTLHQKRIAQSIRLIFDDMYLDSYRVILPKLENHLFVSDNLVPLPRIDPPSMKEYALGAFLHDMGKIANLDYFESNAEYNSKEIRQHVFLSSGLILMNYGVEHEKARLMAGDHHNALFHKDGYGVTRLEREKGMRKLDEVQRCIGIDADDFMSGRSLGFLPTEMLAIADIYDAMTDSSRVYKKTMNPTEALVFMNEKPLAKGMIDPILFDIFVDFIRTVNPEIPETMGLMRKISRA